ncbi:hypothetical protein AB1Y20_002619 [Prymnesium parvum]|uniref:Uncharacterized protein n=1 Tax=Prymnesium parvum TaxID=97485 RepID=A0AB34JBC8_PRYPA
MGRDDAFASDDEDASLLWGHHRASHDRKGRTRHSAHSRRQCLKGGLFCAVLGSMGGILTLLFPSAEMLAPPADVWTRSATSLAAIPHVPVAATSAATTPPAHTTTTTTLASTSSSSPSSRTTSSVSSSFLSPASAAAAASTTERLLSSSHPHLRASFLDVSDVEKAPSDSRAYRALTLSNGMRVVLVSDATSASAAAAVDVNVGSWHDPEHLPGLAHFNEHMMFFLPRDVYPRVDEIQAFVSEHGGYTNAYTAETHTNYYLSVDSHALRPALERFALSFARPSFERSMVQQEVHAVNSEHMKNLQSDLWRDDQLLKTVSNPAHPFHKFGTGSLQTLNSHPGLHEALVKWHDAHYSANKSTLVIVGPQSLDTLQEYSLLFNQTVSRATRTPDWQHSVALGAMPFAPPESLPRMYLVQPVSQQETLTLTWQLPGVRSEAMLASKPLSYLSFLLGSEHEGSLLLNLIDRSLANSLSAGTELDEKELALFQVTVSLTHHGVANWRDVVKLVLSAVKQVREHGISAPLSARQAKESELAFKMAEKQEPYDYASSLASSLHDYPSRQVLTGPALISSFDAPSTRAIADLLSPHSMVLRLTSSTLTQTLAQDALHRTDPYYGTIFKPLQLSSAFVAECDALPVDPQLRLPLPTNPFLADDLSMLAPPTPPPLDSPPPALTAAAAAARLWHRLDTSFAMPYASASIAITLPPLSASVDASALASLFVSLATEQLKPTLSDAAAAQLSLEVALGSTALSLTSYGLSPKLPTLLASATAVLASLPISANRFTAHKQMLLDSLTNAVYTPKPTDLTKRLFSEATLKHYASSADTLHALTNLTHDRLLHFSHSLFSTSFTEMLVMGNVDADGAASIMHDLQAKLGGAPLAPEHRAVQARARLDGSYLLSARNPNPHETDGAVRLVLELGALDAAGAARARALSDLISQPFFYELRTVQQLGYIVQSAASEERGVTYLVFLVQSATPPHEVARRIDAFLASVPARLANTTAATFAGVVRAAASELLEPPKTLSSVADDAWAEIIDRTFRFNRSKAVAAALRSTTRESVLDFWNQKCASSRAGRMLIQVYGSKHVQPHATGTVDGYTVLSTPADFRKHASFW